MTKKTDTSWSDAAEWYSEYLESPGKSYQKDLILPNLLRILSIKPGMRILDLACGQGFFSRAFLKAGAEVTGADLSKELIAEAKKLSPEDIRFHIASADKLAFAKKGEFDAAVVVLAVENIEPYARMCAEAARVLARGGRLVIVMMHPAFRIPKRSSWGWDGESQVQYRRIDAYLSQASSELSVHPGKKGGATTVSFHRSLQDVLKPLFKAGFMLSKLEEWNSDRVSQKGPRQKAEDTARKEIPLFLMIEATLSGK